MWVDTLQKDAVPKQNIFATFPESKICQETTKHLI